MRLRPLSTDLVPLVFDGRARRTSAQEAARRLMRLAYAALDGALGANWSAPQSVTSSEGRLDPNVSSGRSLTQAAVALMSAVVVGRWRAAADVAAASQQHFRTALARMHPGAVDRTARIRSDGRTAAPHPEDRRVFLETLGRTWAHSGAVLDVTGVLDETLLGLMNQILSNPMSDWSNRYGRVSMSGSPSFFYIDAWAFFPGPRLSAADALAVAHGLVVGNAPRSVVDRPLSPLGTQVAGCLIEQTAQETPTVYQEAWCRAALVAPWWRRELPNMAHYPSWTKAKAQWDGAALRAEVAEGTAVVLRAPGRRM